MYGFSKILLEFAIDRAAERIPRYIDPRVSECVDVIRHYVTHTIAGWPAADYSSELGEAVDRLAVIALQHRELLIASRLRQIAAQLDSLPQEHPATHDRVIATHRFATNAY